MQVARAALRIRSRRKRLLAILRSDLEAVKSPSQANIPVLLEKLILYCRDIPQETARFTKDVDFLRQANKKSNRWVAIRENLIQIFKRRCLFHHIRELKDEEQVSPVPRPCYRLVIALLSMVQPHQRDTLITHFVDRGFVAQHHQRQVILTRLPILRLAILEDIPVGILQGAKNRLGRPSP